MSDKKINNTDLSKRILIAPLDWGLGHTTRLIPIIRFLNSIGCTTIIACDETAKSLLGKEFPSLTYIPLQGYNIQYSKNGTWLILKLLAQLPRVLKQIFMENEWVKKAVIEYKIDAIISDNRPSFFHKDTPSVYITHQVQIFSKIALIRNYVNHSHVKFIDKYRECWVPDFEGINSLAGYLSHPKPLPKTPLKYIGPLSRFSPSVNGHGEKIVALISGPEPQRSILEVLLTTLLRKLDKPAVLIVGKPKETQIKSIDGNLTVFNHLETKELERQLQDAKLIIARAGYSTIMDLLYLQKNAILIPTPGQSEQEYLAEYIGNEGNFIFVDQNEQEINKAILSMEEKIFKPKEVVIASFQNTVEAFVNSL